MKQTNSSDEELDEYGVYALAKRLGITKDEMLDMSYISLMNILISSVGAEDDTKMATQEDINKFFK